MGHDEGLVENYLRKEAAKNDILCYKFTSPGTNGVPDDILITKGYVVFVETKSATGQLSEIQKYRIKEIENHGGIVYVCYTKDAVDELINILKHKRKRNNKL